jgi:hypothetical protein
VTVDGLDQTPYRRGKPKGPVARGELLERLSAPGLDVVHGLAQSPRYEASHRRRVVFVADEYWLIEDVLEGERAHRYDLRFHLAPDAGAPALEEGEGATLVRTEGLALAVVSPGAITIEEGFVSPTYGVKLAAPVVRAAAVGREARFLTLVLPLEGRAPAPRLRVARSGDATRVEVAGVGPGGGACDTVLWGPRPVSIEAGPLRARAGAAWTRRSAQGEAVAAAVCGLAGEAPGRWLSWSAEHGSIGGEGAP